MNTNKNANKGISRNLPLKLTTMKSFFTPKRLRATASLAATLASLTVAANNAAQFYRHIQSPPIPVERILPTKR